jgi:hypothetical protein
LDQKIISYNPQDLKKKTRNIRIMLRVEGHKERPKKPKRKKRR